VGRKEGKRKREERRGKEREGNGGKGGEGEGKFLSWRPLEQCLGVTLHMNSLEFALNFYTCIYTLSM
jgi:hypothetical protein